MEASKKGHVEIMKSLIKAGADLHAFRLNNALYHALRSKNVDAVKLLMASGLTTFGESARTTPLHMAAERNDAAMLSLLIEHGAGDVSAVDNQGYTALQCAAKGSGKDTTASLAALLDRGAAIDQLSHYGQSVLHIAADRGKLPAVMLLLDRGANATLADRDKQTALHKAYYKVEIMTALLAKGAPVNALDDKGMTALHHCAAFRDSGSEQDITASTAALLDHGAAIDQLSRDGKTALHYAAERRSTATVLLLLDRGANAALADKDGETALHKAYTDLKMLTALLAHGAPVNAADDEGWTVLHHLAAHGYNMPAASALLQAGANVNATDKDGDAPLHCWAGDYRTAVEFAQLLIDHGADVAAHNNANQRPSDVAGTGSTQQTFLLAAEEAQRNNHRYKRPRPEDLQPPAAIAAGAEAAAATEEEEDESEDDSDDEEEDD
jgi:ankyrin repeat protein